MKILLLFSIKRDIELQNICSKYNIIFKSFSDINLYNFKIIGFLKIKLHTRDLIIFIRKPYCKV